MSKKARPRALPENEAKAVTRSLRQPMAKNSWAKAATQKQSVCARPRRLSSPRHSSQNPASVTAATNAP
jgi:hypothetical protein